MSYVYEFFRSSHYHMSSENKKKDIQMKRLKKLIKYASARSELFAEMYKDIGSDFKLSDLPITSKQFIMENYNDWVTDKAIDLDELKTFVADTSNVGKLFLNKYMVITTSGSTGYPFINLNSKRSVDSISLEALFAGEVSTVPLALIGPTDRFLIPTGMIMENRRRFPIIKLFGMYHIDSTKPMDETVDTIIKIKPKTLIGTTSTLWVVADKCAERNVKLNVKDIVCGSELLTDQAREYLGSVFGGRAKNIYGCTEGGNIAYECKKGHLHLHNANVIIEPVDENNNPVPPGTKSHKVLVTNLNSFTVPIIRYEVTDKITYHDEPCSCGSHTPWIEIEGRTSNPPLVFNVNGKRTTVSPMSIYILISTLNTIRRSQLVFHGSDTCEVRINFMPGVDEKAVYEQIVGIIENRLATNGINGIKYYLSDQLPQIDPTTLKFRSIIQVDD